MHQKILTWTNLIILVVVVTVMGAAFYLDPTSVW